MPRAAIEDFNDEPVARVYRAARLAEAQLVEAELNRQNVAYAVEVESHLAAAVSWLSEHRSGRFMRMRRRRTFLMGFFQRRV